MTTSIVIGRTLARSPLWRFATDLPAGVAGVLLRVSPPAARAADLPVKAPAAAPYRWAGCYLGLNGGGAPSGSDFTSAVDNGTHLLQVNGDPATVSAAGNGSANASNFLGGGQAGCNWQSGTFVYGLEGDVDYFRSNPQFINGTATLSDGATTFTVTQSLTTNVFATVRPRFGVS